jgi:DNA-directed RNA polymerase specialized sigma24 family protein
MNVSKLAARKAKLLLMRLDQPQPAAQVEAEDASRQTECLRRQTLTLVQHFFELSSQVGRLPSLLGREFFRARVSHHAVPSFEDQAVFVCDVERCLARLSDEHAQVIALVGLYRFTQDEAADILHRPSSSVHVVLMEALDCLGEILLRARLLTEDNADRGRRQVNQAGLPADVAAMGRKPPQSVQEARQSASAQAQVGGKGGARRLVLM